MFLLSVWLGLPAPVHFQTPSFLALCFWLLLPPLPGRLGWAAAGSGNRRVLALFKKKKEGKGLKGLAFSFGTFSFERITVHCTQAIGGERALEGADVQPSIERSYGRVSSNSRMRTWLCLLTRRSSREAGCFPAMSTSRVWEFERGWLVRKAKRSDK